MDKQTQPIVISIGQENSKPVIRIVMPDRSIIHADTNFLTFAKLAAAGIRVVNSR